MKLNGDVSKEDQELASKLTEAEIEMILSPLSKEKKAMIFTCLAHDWFDIGMDEEGIRLVAKAEATCPNYFRDVQPSDMKKNEDYAKLVVKLTQFLITFGMETK